MASAAQGSFANVAPGPESDMASKEQEELLGVSRSSKRNRRDERRGESISTMEGGSRSRRRDVGRAEWRYVCCRSPTFSPD